MGSAFTKEQFLEGARLWSAHIDMRFVWVDRKEDANVFAHRRRIDGRGNTLAWAMLPWHNAKPGDFVSEQRYDSFDFTGSENPVPTGGHEMGHTLGISHIADRSNLMFFAMTGVEELGNQDIAEGVARYGKATNRPPVVPPVDEEPIEGIINSVYFSTEEIGPEVGTVVQGGDSFTAYGRE